MRKNPDNKPLRLVFNKGLPAGHFGGSPHDHEFGLVLSNLALAESNLVRAGKDSAMPHFLALVKALEEHYDFHFEIIGQVTIDQNAVPGVTITKKITDRYACPTCGLIQHISHGNPYPCLVCPDCGIRKPNMELDEK